MWLNSAVNAVVAFENFLLLYNSSAYYFAVALHYSRFLCLSNWCCEVATKSRARLLMISGFTH